MQYRKEPLENGQIYHIFNKSIAGFKIFNCEADYFRIIETIKYYQRYPVPVRYSELKRLSLPIQQQILINLFNQKKIVEVVAYCLMPTHLHLILKQLAENGIRILMSNVENSYARYFNTKYKRKGPLWVGRFKSVFVQNESQLYHLSRYVHLNPISANLTNKPEEWFYSSYNEYLNNIDNNLRICDYKDIISIKPKTYREFVESRASYQRQISKIKKLMFD
ncbi:MAG: hypothetical protein ACD_26C00167G0003 [uncultured bacterium]|nr:MAG: hypothetical protein ACD_26C00167G0003 [uncultured bacterium]